jgi:hypothetical protein
MRLRVIFHLNCSYRGILEALPLIARVFLLWFFSATFAYAEMVDVPLQADGSVNAGAVVSTFRLSQDLPASDKGGQFEGAILGAAFSVTYGDPAGGKQFKMAILSKALSEHASYLVAVLILDVICLDKRVKPNPLGWAETAVKNQDGWSVQVSCSNEAHEISE